MHRKKQSSQNPWHEAEEFGIDTTQLRSNLTYSYEERAKKHQHALNLITELKEAKKLHEKSQQSHSDSPKLKNRDKK